MARTPLPNWYTTGLVVAAICGLVVSLQAHAQNLAPSQTSLPAGYAGSQACKECHEDIYKNLGTTPHFKIAFDKRDRSTATGQCESCHGPGKAHIEAGGDPAKIVSFRDMSPAKVNATCLTCHQYGEEHSNFLRSAHKTSDVSCLDCHSAHHYRESQFLMVKSQPELCYQCHGEARGDFAKTFHHRVNEKLIKCTDCHKQHGGFVNAQLRTVANQDAICVRCHVEKAGPFVFEHAPLLTEGCTVCHAPHGSSNPRMLKRSNVNQLCLECHTMTAGLTVRGTPSFHNQATKYQACNMCHSNIHGSNFSQFFFK